MSSFFAFSGEEKVRGMKVASSCSFSIAVVGDGPVERQLDFEVLGVPSSLKLAQAEAFLSTGKFVDEALEPGDIVFVEDERIGAEELTPRTLPHFHHATLINTSSSDANQIFLQLTALFETKGRSLVSEFLGSECGWRCTYFQGQGGGCLGGCSFTVTLFRSQVGTVSVEFARMHGDRAVFYGIFDECSAMLAGADAGAGAGGAELTAPAQPAFHGSAIFEMSGFSSCPNACSSSSGNALDTGSLAELVQRLPSPSTWSGAADALDTQLIESILQLSASQDPSDFCQRWLTAVALEAVSSLLSACPVILSAAVQLSISGLVKAYGLPPRDHYDGAGGTSALLSSRCLELQKYQKRVSMGCM